MEPRTRKDIERIIKQAGYPSAAADLEEFELPAGRRGQC